MSVKDITNTCRGDLLLPLDGFREEYLDTAFFSPTQPSFERVLTDALTNPPSPHYGGHSILLYLTKEYPKLGNVSWLKSFVYTDDVSDLDNCLKTDTTLGKTLFSVKASPEIRRIPDPKKMVNNFKDENLVVRVNGVSHPYALVYYLNPLEWTPYFVYTENVGLMSTSFNPRFPEPIGWNYRGALYSWKILEKALGGFPKEVLDRELIVFLLSLSYAGREFGYWQADEVRLRGVLGETFHKRAYELLPADKEFETLNHLQVFQDSLKLTDPIEMIESLDSELPGCTTAICDYVSRRFGTEISTTDFKDHQEERSKRIRFG